MTKPHKPLNSTILNLSSGVIRSPIRHVLSICAPVYRISSPQAQGKVDVSLFILLEYVVLTMQHWPFCLSPETPPSEDAAQHSQNRGIIRPHHSNFSLPLQMPGNGADLCTGVGRRLQIRQICGMADSRLCLAGPARPCSR
jgi:hypothetical protein